jgi:hypothetical protein
VRTRKTCARTAVAARTYVGVRAHACTHARTHARRRAWKPRGPASRPKRRRRSGPCTSLHYARAATASTANTTSTTTIARVSPTSGTARAALGRLDRRATSAIPGVPVDLHSPQDVPPPPPPSRRRIFLGCRSGDQQQYPELTLPSPSEPGDFVVFSPAYQHSRLLARELRRGASEISNWPSRDIRSILISHACTGTKPSPANQISAVSPTRT